MSKTPAQRIAAAAQELEYEAVVMDGLSKRLFVLGCSKSAHETAKAAAAVARVAKQLVGGPRSDDHNLFFHECEDAIELGRRRDATDTVTVVPVRDGAGAEATRIDTA